MLTLPAQPVLKFPEPSSAPRLLAPNPCKVSDLPLTVTPLISWSVPPLITEAALTVVPSAWLLWTARNPWLISVNPL